MDDTWHFAGPAGRRFLSFTGNKQATRTRTGTGLHRTDDGPFTRDRDRVRAQLPLWAEMSRSRVKWTSCRRATIASSVLTVQE